MNQICRFCVGSAMLQKIHKSPRTNYKIDILMTEENFWFPMYYHKLMHATAGWKDETFGAYLRLLIHQFDKGFIPEDLDELEQISPSIRKNWKIISKKFKPDGNGGLVNPVMAEIRESIIKKKKINKENGAKGGKAKANKKQGSTESVANGTNIHSEGQAIKVNNNYNKIEEPLPLCKIEDCLRIALVDTRWVKANRTNEVELLEFNRLLEKRGEYLKVPIDYKSHFANWKAQGKLEEETTPAVGKTAEELRYERSRKILGI